MEGGVVEDDQWREGSELVWRVSTGEVRLYRRDEVLRESMVADGEVGLWAIRGMGEGMAGLRASWRSSQASLHSKRWSSTVARVIRSSSSPSTVVTVHGGYRSSAAKWACLAAS